MCKNNLYMHDSVKTMPLPWDHNIKEVKYVLKIVSCCNQDNLISYTPRT